MSRRGSRIAGNVPGSQLLPTNRPLVRTNGVACRWCVRCLCSASGPTASHRERAGVSGLWSSFPGRAWVGAAERRALTGHLPPVETALWIPSSARKAMTRRTTEAMTLAERRLFLNVQGGLADLTRDPLRGRCGLEAVDRCGAQNERLAQIFAPTVLDSRKRRLRDDPLSGSRNCGYGRVAALSTDALELPARGFRAETRLACWPVLSGRGPSGRAGAAPAQVEPRGADSQAHPNCRRGAVQPIPSGGHRTPHRSGWQDLCRSRRGSLSRGGRSPAAMGAPSRDHPVFHRVRPPRRAVWAPRGRSHALVPPVSASAAVCPPALPPMPERPLAATPSGDQLPG